MLTLCDCQGLIGRQMFAIDGVKQPSNASKSKSGRRADFIKQAEKMETAAQTMIERHRANDDRPVEPDLGAKELRQIEKLQAEAGKLRTWLAEHPQDRPGARGKPRVSNRTDNESAKMATDKGVIQGYCGAAVVDSQHQIIVEARAHGTGSEQGLLMPMIEATAALRTEQSMITTDAGYHSTDNIIELTARNIPALIADNGMRSRDVRFKGRLRYKTKPDPLLTSKARKHHGTTGHRTSPTTKPPVPVAAQPASCFTKMARTASITAISL